MILFLFESVHAVISADKHCHAAGIHCTIIPVPRSITSQCGICIEADPDREKRIAAILEEQEISYSLCKDYVKRGSFEKLV
ncbi:MAG: hypothetical protein H6Q52_1660 [Deltaproteobacteria bacterium]|jgi:hypothetical protein|nr:hypothetical protein [Deltaproteobacteria bacterium]